MSDLQVRSVFLEYPLPGGSRFRTLEVDALRIPAGAAVGITGPSGAGKTSLLHVLCGLERPTAGSVRWGARDITGLSERQRDRWRREHVGLVFQDFHLFQGMTAGQNVVLPASFGRFRTPRHLRDRAGSLLIRVGLGDGARRIESLSRGEMQRVAVARAALFSPPIVLADEPTASLDRTSGRIAIGDRFAPTHGPAAPRTPDDPGGGEPHGFEYAMVGVMPAQGSPWDRAILVPIESVWEIHGLPTGHPADAAGIGPPREGDVPGVPAIAVKPRSVADAYRLRGKYRTNESMALFPAEVLVELYAMLGDARDLLAAIAVATQALVIAAVLLAVFAALSLRRRELAVLRALGASRGYVFAVVWSRVTLMVSLGAGLGLFLGWVGALVISGLFSSRVGFELPVTVALPQVSMVLALIGVGMLLAAIPSWSSYRQSVASGLRS